MRYQIYKKLLQRYASEDSKVLKEVAYNLSLASVQTEAGFWEKATQAIGRIKEAQAKAPKSILSEAAKKAYSTAIAVCPICKSKMNLILLLDNREAFYCQDHKICQPVPIEMDGE